MSIADDILSQGQALHEKTQQKLEGSDNPIANAIVQEEEEETAELENIAELIKDFKQEIQDEKAELELTQDLEQRLENELAPDLTELEQHQEELAEIINQAEIHNNGGIFQQADLSPDEIRNKFQQLENDVDNLHEDVQEVREEFEEQTKHIRKENQEFEETKELLESLVDHESRIEQMVDRMERFAEEQGRQA
jgi:chromosome segregation ATPase